jgi:hypothetical protein
MAPAAMNSGMAKKKSVKKVKAKMVPKKKKPP